MWILFFIHFEKDDGEYKIALKYISMTEVSGSQNVEDCD